MALVEEDGCADGGDDGTDAEGGLTLDLVQSVGLEPNKLGDFVLFVEIERKDLVDRDATDGHVGPGDGLGVTVLADNVGMDGARGNLGSLSDGVLQTGGVEDGARAEDLAGGEAGVLDGEVGHDVDGVGDHDEDGILLEWSHLLETSADDAEVALEESKAGLASLLVGTSSEDDDVALSALLPRAGADTRGDAEASRVAQILDLGILEVLLEVQDENLAGDLLVDDGVSYGGANLADANDGDSGSLEVRHDV